MYKFWVVLLILQVSVYNVSCEEVSSTDDLKKICWSRSLSRECKTRLLSSPLVEKNPQPNSDLGERAYTFYELKEFYRDVNPGDIVKFPQTGFFHYGIYIGDYENRPHCVVHFTAPEDKIPTYIPRSFRYTTTTIPPQQRTTTASLPFDEPNRGLTQMTPLKDFFGVYHSVIIERNSHNMTAHSDHEVVRRARYDFEKDYGKDHKYHILWNNCESFANSIRYTSIRSFQAEKFIELLTHKPPAGIVL